MAALSPRKCLSVAAGPSGRRAAPERDCVEHASGDSQLVPTGARQSWSVDPSPAVRARHTKRERHAERGRCRGGPGRVRVVRGPRRWRPSGSPELFRAGGFSEHLHARFRRRGGALTTPLLDGQTLPAAVPARHPSLPGEGGVRSVRHAVPGGVREVHQAEVRVRARGPTRPGNAWVSPALASAALRVRARPASAPPGRPGHGRDLAEPSAADGAAPADHLVRPVQAARCCSWRRPPRRTRRGGVSEVTQSRQASAAERGC